MFNVNSVVNTSLRTTNIYTCICIINFSCICYYPINKLININMLKNITPFPITTVYLIVTFLSFHTCAYLPISQPSSSSVPFFSFAEDFVEAKMGEQIRHFLSVYVGQPPQELKLKLSTALYSDMWFMDIGQRQF